MPPASPDPPASAQSTPPLPRPHGRFNEWGKKDYIVVPPEQADRIEREVAAMRLTPRARQLMRAAKLTRSAGYEFVFISNAQFPESLDLNGGKVQIVPCFRPFPPQGGGTVDIHQMAMMSKGRFIYDGWIPDDSLSPSFAEKAARELDAIASAVSLVGSYYAHWEPKYFARDPVPSFIVSQGEVLAFRNALASLSGMPAADATALRRTIGWLSSAASSGSPIDAFLDYFVALESLVTYIERETSPDSPLSAFARTKGTRTERQQDTSNCISQKLATAPDLVQAIKEAYFDCVVGTRRLLEDHLKRLFPHDSHIDTLFKPGPSTDSLWDIRGRIAHGDLDILSEAEVSFVAASLPALEDLVRSYVRTVASQATRSEFFSRRRRPALTFSAAEGYGAPGTVYKGPTSMAETYLGTTDLEGPHVEVTFEP